MWQTYLAGVDFPVPARHGHLSYRVAVTRRLQVICGEGDVQCAGVQLNKLPWLSPEEQFCLIQRPLTNSH